MAAPPNPSETQSAYVIPAALDFQEVLKTARQHFYKLDSNIIGINIAPRRVKGSVRPHEYALVVYVMEKKAQSELDPAKIIPKEFLGLKTDVHAPLSADAPQPTAGVVTEHHGSNELSGINWVRVHEFAVSLERPPTIPHAANVRDFGDVCVIQDDGTVVKTNPGGTRFVDFVRAYQLFRTLHGDDYDFVTFFVDSDNGMPGVFNSYWSGIFNDVHGIGLGPFDDRAGWGTSRLQAFHVMNQGSAAVWRYVMLQEFGHQFAAFARYRDPVTGATMTDHLVDGILGHWSENLDDDKSPMDYDANDWVELANGEFRRVFLNSDERTYCNLDLYLMGLLGPNQVGEFTMLRDVASIAGSVNYSATPVRLNIQNFIAQEGPRIPNVADAPKDWRQAFIVLTNDMHKVHDFADKVDSLRLRWERDFREATKGRGRIDTMLGDRRGGASDFTVVAAVRQGFGDDPGYLNDIEANVPFVGASKEFSFHCANVNPDEAAVLMFQSRAVNSSRNVVTINGKEVFGGIPVSPSTDTWNGNVMLISAGTLKPTDNQLHIESRTLEGGTGDDIDNFILDNIVVMYKTRLRGSVRS